MGSGLVKKGPRIVFIPKNDLRDAGPFGPARASRAGCAGGERGGAEGPSFLILCD